jgi:hypothetical protein
LLNKDFQPNEFNIDVQAATYYAIEKCFRNRDLKKIVATFRFLRLSREVTEDGDVLHFKLDVLLKNIPWSQSEIQKLINSKKYRKDP